MKIRVFCLVLGMFFLVGCGKEENSTKTSKDSSSESSYVESSKKESSNSIEESLQSTEQDMFSLMIEAAQSQLPTIKEQLGAMYKDMTITEGDNHTIIYTYTFAQDPGLDVDMEALKPTLAKGLKPVIDGTKAMFPDVKVKAIFLKPDGTEIGNMTITTADIDALSNSSTAQ